MSGSSRREIERRLDELEDENVDDGTEIIIRDTVVETPWSADDAETGDTTVTRLRWDGGGWVEVEG